MPTFRSLSQETMVECKDLDEITTKEDICQALIEQFAIESLEDWAIKSIRKAYGGTQTAIISLSIATVHKLIEPGRVTIEWTVCKLNTTEKML